MDYLFYILAVLVIGLASITAVRLATRSKNPDLLLQYEARKKAARAVVTKESKITVMDANGNPVAAVKSLRQRHQERVNQAPTPWGWPGAEKEASQPVGISETVRNFADRLVRQKQLVQNDGNSSSGSIRALLEDRYGPVDRGMTEISYQKVKRPLLRDPSEMHDQLDNLGSAEARQLRKKLQFLSAMTPEDQADGASGSSRKSKNVEFRYVELKDLKQPWGW